LGWERRRSKGKMTDSSPLTMSDSFTPTLSQKGARGSLPTASSPSGGVENPTYQSSTFFKAGRRRVMQAPVPVFSA
jgi:hypothetical protein